MLTKKGSGFRVRYAGFSEDFVHSRRCCTASNFNEDSEKAGRCRSIGPEITEFRNWSSGTCGRGRRAMKLALQLPTPRIFGIEQLCINNSIFFVCLKAAYQLEARLNGPYTYIFVCKSHRDHQLLYHKGRTRSIVPWSPNLPSANVSVNGQQSFVPLIWPLLHLTVRALSTFCIMGSDTQLKFYVGRPSHSHRQHYPNLHKH